MILLQITRPRRTTLFPYTTLFRSMETAARQRVVTQMGTQIHNTGDNYRRVVEIVQAGVLGPIRRVHVWCNRRPDAMFLVKERDRKSTRLNSSHVEISYAVFCLKKK